MPKCPVSIMDSQRPYLGHLSKRVDDYVLKISGLALLFAFTACLYASVGFGGGSTYTALLVASGADFALIPIVALSCNIVVVSGNTLRYSSAGLIPWSKLWPILLLSVPMAWLGGRLNIPETLFIGLLAFALLFAGVRLLLKKNHEDAQNFKSISWIQSGGIGAAIGFYSGLVGIGGGIFLAPLLYAFNWGSAKTIAAACSVFILFNSLSGFLGQLLKLSDINKMTEAMTYWPVIPAVLIGGFIGNAIGLNRLSQQWVQRLTGLLILVVALRLGVDWIGRLN